MVLFRQHHRRVNTISHGPNLDLTWLARYECLLSVISATEGNRHRNARYQVEEVIAVEAFRFRRQPYVASTLLSSTNVVPLLPSTSFTSSECPVSSRRSYREKPSASDDSHTWRASTLLSSTNVVPLLPSTSFTWMVGLCRSCCLRNAVRP